MADKKITQLIAATMAEIDDTDVLPIVNDTEGSPVTKKVTVRDFKTLRIFDSADPTTPLEGEIWCRSDLDEIRVFLNTATYILNVTPAS